MIYRITVLASFSAVITILERDDSTHEEQINEIIECFRKLNEIPSETD